MHITFMDSYILQVDVLAEALMPPGVRSLRSMLHATAVEVLLPFQTLQVPAHKQVSLLLRHRRMLQACMQRRTRMGSPLSSCGLRSMTQCRLQSCPVDMSKIRPACVCWLQPRCEDDTWAVA